MNIKQVAEKQLLEDLEATKLRKMKELLIQRDALDQNYASDTKVLTERIRAVDDLTVADLVSKKDDTYCYTNTISR